MIFVVYLTLLTKHPTNQEPMLPNYQNLNTDSLVELLAHETEKLTKLLAEKKFDDEYNQCKEGIRQMQVLIEIRKEATATPPPVFEQPKTTFENTGSTPGDQ